MITLTVCGVSIASRDAARNARVGAEHRQHEELRQGHAEIGQRAFHVQAIGRAGLPQQIRQIAAFAALAFAGCGNPRGSRQQARPFPLRRQGLP
jgi:alkylhydroperoxidase/carboxymuconolactone decarboxylase family protein YurZ